MITLYNYELSGNCYKLRLLMNLLGLSYRTVDLEFYPGKEHKGEAFLAINPLGQLPALDDDGYVLRDAQAILTYLAARYDASGTWYPVQDPRRLGEVNMWLAFADGITDVIRKGVLHFINLPVGEGGDGSSPKNKRKVGGAGAPADT